MLCDDIRRQSLNPQMKFYAFGHSMGALAICAAQVLRPSLFDRAILIEPVIFPIASLNRGEFPLVIASLKRKAGFASFAEAKANFLSKEVFKAFDPRCLGMQTYLAYIYFN